MSSSAKIVFPKPKDIAGSSRVYLRGFNGGAGHLGIDGTLLDLGNKLPGVLKAYKEQRMAGKEIDAPERPFPSHGFEELDIKQIGWQHSSKWPDTEKCYWWKLTHRSERLLNDFYWKADTKRGYPSEAYGQRGFWFTVHYASSATTADRNTAIEGFSLQLYRNEKYEDDLCWFYEDCYAEYRECGPIEDWFEEMDRNHEARLKREGKVSQSTIDEENQFMQIIEPEEDRNIAAEKEITVKSEHWRQEEMQRMEMDLNSSALNHAANSSTISLPHTASNLKNERSCCSFFSSFFSSNPTDENEASLRPNNNIKS